MKLRTEVTDSTWPMGIARMHLEEHVQEWLDRGWHLRGQFAVPVGDPNGLDSAVRVFCTFVQPAQVSKR
jgi:hypothetical protein